MQAPTAQAQTLGNKTITLTYNNNRVTFSVDEPGDSTTGWWSKIGNAASDCSTGYSGTDNFESSGGSYSKTFTGNGGKYICIRHRRPDLNSFTDEVIITTGSALITYPPDNTAPTVTAAAVNGTTLTVTFSEDMSSSKAANSAWSVSAGGSSVSVSSYTLSGTGATLTLAAAVNASQTVTLGYTKPGSGNKLQDTGGNDLATFSGQAVTNNTPYPTVEAERSTNQLTIYEGDTATFTYVLKANPHADRTIQIAPDHDDLKIVKTDGSKVDELTLTFTADDWDDAQTVTLSVEQDADQNDVQGAQDVNFTLDDKLTHASGSNATLTVEMLDDDASPALTLSEASLSVAEGGSDTFTVRLAGRPSANVTVSLVQPSNSTNADVNFTPASLSFTSANWHTAQTVTVSATEDADGRDDTATISLSASGGDYAGIKGTVAVAVTDDELGDLEFSTTSLNVDESGSEIFTVKLTGQPSASVTLTLVQPSNSTNTDVNFTPASLTFTTGNWATAQNVTVSAANDGDAGDDTATISLTASGGGYAGITGRVRITVRDDDDIDRVPASFNPRALANITATEGSVVARSIALSRRPSANVTVALSSDNSDVTFASDSAGSSAITSLSFTRANWSTAQTFYTVLGDDSDTDNDTASVTLSSSGGGFAGLSTSYGVTVIDAGKPNIIPSVSPVVVDEDGTATVEVRLSEAGKLVSGLETNVSFDVVSSDTSVFTVSPNVLPFNAAGNSTPWNEFQTLTITPVNDSTFTSAVKNATINIRGSSNFGLFNYRRSDGTFTIPVQVRDDDAPPGLTLSETSLTVAEGGADTFTVRLAGRPDANVTVTLAQPSNTDVTLDTDTGAASNQNTLTFTTDNWSTAQTVTVNAVDDADGSNDSASIALSASGGGYAGVTGSVRVTVRDIDGGAAGFNPTTLSSVTGTEGSTVARSIALSRRPSANVTVSLSSDNSDITFASDSAGRTAITSLSFTRANWSTAQTFYTVLGDDSDTDNDTAEVTLTATGGGFSGVTASYGVTVIDAGKPNIIPSVSPVAVNEDGTAAVEVRLSEAGKLPGGLETNVSFDVVSSDTSVFTVSPNLLTFNAAGYSTPWNEFQTLTITPVNDSTFTSAVKNATINIRGSSNFGLFNYRRSDGTFTIPVQVRDDDTPPAGTINVTPGGTLTIDEGDSTGGTFSVSLSAAPSANVTVSLTKTNSDVTLSPTSLTFTATDWGTAQNVTVTAAEDNDTADDTDTITLSASGGITASAVTKDVSITDNDTPAGAIEVTPAGTLTIAEGGTGTLMVRLSAMPNADVTVTLAKTNDDVTLSGATLSSSELTFTSANYSTEQSVTVTAAADSDTTDDTDTITFTATGGITAPNVTKDVSITDNDPPPGMIEVTPAGTLTIAEGGSGTLMVRLSAKPNADVTVTLAKTNDDVTLSGATLSSSALTFTSANYSTLQSVTVTAAADGDSTDDSDTITFTATGGITASTVTKNVSITDSDPPAGAIEVTPAGTLTIAEGGSGTLMVKLNAMPNADVKVTLAKTNDDVTLSGATLSSSELTFTSSNYSTVQTVTVTAGEDGDSTDDSDTITFTATGGITAPNVTKEVSITDNDDKPAGAIEVTPAGTLTIAEGGSGTLMVRLSAMPNANVTVTLAKTNDDVTLSGSTLSSSALTFTSSNYSTVQSVTVTAGDDSDTTDDTDTITFTASGGITALAVTKEVSITDDDGRFEITNSDNAPVSSLEVGENDSAIFRVRLTSEPSDDVTVTLAQTGTTNSDITVDTNPATAGNQDELTFTTTDWDDPQTVTVNAADDDDAVVDTATIKVSAKGGGYDNFESSLSVTVTENDTAGLEITNSANADLTRLKVNEGGNAVFRVRLTSQPSDEVTVTLSQPTDGTANSDVTFDTDDSTAGDQDELTFTADDWDDPQTVTVSAAADSDADGESATINLTAEDGGYDGVTGRVAVDVTDTTPRLILTPTELTIDEGKSKVFTAQLSRQPQRSTDITLESSNPDVTLSLTSLTFTTSNWNAARTITVQTARDPDPDDDEAVVSLSGSGIVTGSVTVTVTDDGKIGLDLSEEELTVVEGEQGSFTVKLHTEPSANLSVALESSNPEVTLSSTSLTFTGGDNGNWNTAQTVTVIAADDEDNDDDTATISLTGSGVIEDSVAVTVTDDDTGATLEAEQAAAAVILAEVVGALLPAAGDAIGRRFDSPRSGRTATVAGRQVALDRSLAQDLAAGFAARAGVQDTSKQGRYAEDRFGAERHSSEWLGGIPLDAGRPLRSADQRSSGMSGASALLSDFSYALNAGAGGGGGWSIWGRFDTGEFSGSNDGVEFDSSSSNIWFGADRRSDSGFLSGIAYSSSGSDADYILGQFGAALETDLTLVLPYLETEFDGGATGHAMLGIGSGEATITQTDKQQGSADLSVYMLTAGGSWPTLWEIGSAALSWSGDFGYTSLTTSGSELPSLDGLSVSSMQLRGGLELRFDELGYGWKTTPHAALLMRLDAGDGVTGTGFELTGGLQMASGSSERFSLDLNLRTLVMHSAEELTDWGMSIQVRVKPFGDGSGLGFALGPHWGAPEGDGLLDRDEAFRLDQAGRQSRQARQQSRGLTADLGYGLRAFGGMLTPYSEYRLTSGDAGSIRQLAGVRFSNSAALELRLFTERHIARLGESRSRLAVELQKRY